MQPRCPAGLVHVRHRRKWRLYVAACCIPHVPASIAAEDKHWSSSLPSAPKGITETDDMLLHLELVVNGRASGKIVPVQMRHGHYHVMVDDLRDVGLPVDGDAGVLVRLDDVKGITTQYDEARLQLRMTVPADWLPHQNVGRSTRLDYVPASVSTGMLVNYEAYVANADRGNTQLALWNEVRLFGRAGMFSTTGVYRAGGESSHTGYRRYDSIWRYSDEQNMMTYEAGDLVTRGLGWGSTVRLGGMQISRDFAIRPDVITYPLPRFSGTAELPSAVDLFINGTRAEGAEVNPGPFTLSNVPFVNGAGEAVVVVTDALGRQVSTNIAFYVSSAVLRRGLTDFAISAGMMRRDFGIRNFAYGAMAGSASLRHGVTDSLTAEFHAEAGEGFARAGVGGVVRLGPLGTINSNWSLSRMDDRSGHQWGVGYQYSGRGFTITAQHQQRSDDFADLGAYDRGVAHRRSGITSVTGSMSVSGMGSVGGGYFQTKGHGGQVSRLANLSWNIPVDNRFTLYAAGNRAIGEDRWSATMQIILPLGRRRGNVSAGYEHDGRRGSSWRMNYNRIPPVHGGVGWNMAYADGSSAARYVQADAIWRNSIMEMRGGMYGGDGNYTRWGNISGSVAIMGGATSFTSRVMDSFALVSTNGEKDIPVHYENQLVGKTDKNGHLLIPWGSAYYRAQYSIDPLGLPAHIETPVTSRNIAIRRGSGYILHFPVVRVMSATVQLRDDAGNRLPVGTAVRVNDQPDTHVGWDGIAFVRHLQAENNLLAHMPDGTRCSAGFAHDMNKPEAAEHYVLTCHTGELP